ncbi:hypothetical protein MTO96_001023 [Rhipicephalus appendiculatus]
MAFRRGQSILTKKWPPPRDRPFSARRRGEVGKQRTMRPLKRGLRTRGSTLLTLAAVFLCCCWESRYNSANLCVCAGGSFTLRFPPDRGRLCGRVSRLAAKTRTGLLFFLEIRPPQGSACGRRARGFPPRPPRNATSLGLRFCALSVMSAPRLPRKTSPSGEEVVGQIRRLRLVLVSVDFWIDARSVGERVGLYRRYFPATQ